MKGLRIALAGMIALCLSSAPTVSGKGKDDRDRGNRLRATLVGPNEVPSVHTDARGTFRATIAPDGQSFNYTLSFDGITSAVAQSHIHFARPDVNGGIVIWLCQGTARVPATLPAVAAATPECPTSPGGTVSGMITPALVVPVATQQIVANDLDGVIEEIRAGRAYANVHSATSPGGEIRGQIRTNGDDDDRDR